MRRGCAICTAELLLGVTNEWFWLVLELVSWCQDGHVFTGIDRSDGLMNFKFILLVALRCVSFRFFGTVFSLNYF